MTHAPDLLTGTPLAALWPTLPTLDGAIDPFSFRQRMALYRVLMDSINARGLFGERNEHNIFWGYTFQVHWQWRSGRYRLSEDQPDDLLHPNSIWGYNNFSLCVIPYIAAVREGLAPDMAIRPAPDGCPVAYATGGGADGPFNVPPIYDEAVREWGRFFAGVAALDAGADREPVRFALWKAHKASLDAAEEATPRLYPGHSKLEQEFLHGWVRMVDFLGAAAWRTDLAFMQMNGLDVLPERTLTDADVPGRIPDMSAEVNANLRSIFDLVRLPGWRFGFNLWLWKRAMRTRQARDEVLPMLSAQFAPTAENAADRRRLVRYMLNPRPRRAD
jgi:hypothetical protein